MSTLAVLLCIDVALTFGCMSVLLNVEKLIKLLLEVLVEEEDE